MLHNPSPAVTAMSVHHHGLLQNFYSMVHLADVSADGVDVHFLENVIAYWANRKGSWFSHDPIDHFPMVSGKYYDGAATNLALVLHYDQIFRHPSPLVQERNKPAAYRFATHIALRMIHRPYFSSMKPWEKVFVLLALRHNDSLKLKQLALSKLYIALAEDATNALYLRFLKATIWDIHMCKESAGYPAENMEGRAVDTSCFQQVLAEPWPLDARAENMDHDKELDKLADLFDDTLRQHLKPGKMTAVAVSISGGVDSMLCSVVVNRWCRRQPGRKMILLHICYNNRAVVDQEVLLLKWWAQKLDAPLYVRVIDEIFRSRHAAFRTVYEEMTRRIRFSMYKYFDCPVVLGHNQNDSFENIFSNLSRGIHFGDLVAMQTNSVEDGIPLVRPLLGISKADIFRFSRVFSIPHLVDSTPEWSNRGKMRDVLIPSIHNFDPGILPGLYDFVNYSKFLARQWQMFFEKWCTEGGCTKGTDVIFIVRDAFFHENFLNIEFWVRIWFVMNMPTRPSNKSFGHIISMLKKGQLGRTSLNRVYDAVLEENRVVCLMKKMFEKGGYTKGQPLKL